MSENLTNQQLAEKYPDLVYDITNPVTAGADSFMCPDGYVVIGCHSIDVITGNYGKDGLRTLRFTARHWRRILGANDQP